MTEGLPRIPADAYSRALSGELVTGTQKVEGARARKLWGVGVVDASIHTLWGAINDELLQPEFTTLTYAARLSGEACTSGRHVLQVVDVGVPLVADRWWVTERTPNPELETSTGGQVREMRWENAPNTLTITDATHLEAIGSATRVTFTRGSWLLIRLNDRQTLTQYYSWADPGGNLDPAMMAWFTGKTVRKTFAAMDRLSKDQRLACIGPE